MAGERTCAACGGATSGVLCHHCTDDFLASPEYLRPSATPLKQRAAEWASRSKGERDAALARAREVLR